MTSGPPPTADPAPPRAPDPDPGTATPGEPAHDWSYSRPLRILVTLFVAYHLLFLLVANLPERGLPAGFVRTIGQLARFKSYAGATGSHQGWAVFSPAPSRSNVFVRVLVVDAGGRTWDLGHDIHGRRRYPYLFYDRLAKINRRLLRVERDRQPYAAWVCRDWEHRHGGERAREVRLVRVWTRIPPPAAAYRTMGYDPRALEVREAPVQSYPCASTPDAQLPEHLRRRFGLPPPEAPVHAATARTWWTARRDGAVPAPGSPPDPVEEQEGTE